MLRRTLLRALLASPLPAWLGLPACGEEANAAEVYRRAFAWSRGVTAEDAERFRGALAGSLDDPRLRRLLRGARPALGAIRDAARIEACAWGPGPVAADELGQDRLDVLNLRVIHAACLSARVRAAAGRGLEALDDVFAALALAHRIGTDGVWFARVLEAGGELAAFQTIGRILPRLDRETRDDLARRLARLADPEPPSATIGPESRFVLGSLRRKAAAMGPTLDADDWHELGYDATESVPLVRLSGGDRDRFLMHLDAEPPAFAELARRIDRPREECRAALDAFAHEWRDAAPIASGLAEKAWMIRHVVDRMRALRTLASAALVLVRDGEPAVRALRDPFGTGGFDLERKGPVVVIRSGLLDEGKPVVQLEIGESTAG
jgi:hypothetical protein